VRKHQVQNTKKIGKYVLSDRIFVKTCQASCWGLLSVVYGVDSP